MKKRMMVLVQAVLFIVIACSGAWGSDIKYTKEGMACLTKDDLNQVITFAAQKDYEAMAGMVSQGKCVMLKPNLPVYILDTTWSGYVEIRLKGYPGGSIWTLSKYVTR